MDFALQAGKLIQNFGLVELTSYRWLGVLTQNPMAVEISRELALSKRIDIVLRLIDRDTKLGADEKDKARTLWKQVRDKGCELRNAVAHGTVGLAIKGDDPTAQPHAVGILKIRKWSDTDALISLDELRGAVNSTAQIVEELNELLGEDF